MIMARCGGVYLNDPVPFCILIPLIMFYVLLFLEQDENGRREIGNKLESPYMRMAKYGSPILSIDCT